MNITRHLLTILLLLTATHLGAQGNRVPPVDKSPLDISFYPSNYPILKIQQKITEPLLARVIYSRPSKGGRTILGDLVEYGKVWRMGANEATEIEFFKDMKVQSQKLKKGRYTLYAIPAQDHWTIIFNRETDTWGAFIYDSAKDALRIDLKSERSKEMHEVLSMYFETSNTGFELIMLWDDIKLSIPFSADEPVKGKK